MNAHPALRATLALLLPVMIAGTAHGESASPYAGQESRPIAALSESEVSALLEGRGMGFARPAELHGYPGPAHVLELADSLQLSDAQRRQTEALFASMQAEARRCGRRLVEAERHLDALFRSHAVTPQELSLALHEIGAIQAELRNVHLQAHLEQARLLTPAQVAQYASLRGYADSGRDHVHH